MHNAQTVLDALSQLISMDLAHIKGEAMIDGDRRALSNLCNIFLRIINIAHRQVVTCLICSFLMQNHLTRPSICHTIPVNPVGSVVPLAPCLVASIH